MKKELLVIVDNHATVKLIFIEYLLPVRRRELEPYEARLRFAKLVAKRLMFC
jgi:hypothetical protein